MPPSCHDLPFLRPLLLRTWGRSSLLGHPRKPISGFPGNICPGQDPSSLKPLLFLSRFPLEDVAGIDPGPSPFALPFPLCRRRCQRCSQLLFAGITPPLPLSGFLDGRDWLPLLLSP